MRFIFKILLGLVIFNAMLVFFAPYFPSQTTGANESAVDIGGTLGGYKQLDQDFLISLFVDSVFIFGSVLVIGGLASFFVKNFPTGLFMGAGVIIAIVSSLWKNLTSPMISLAGSYPAVEPLYNLLVICIGVIATFSIAEIFTGKGDVDA